MKAFYCPGTHWDREWYQPFQEFRMWLVELIDEVMDLLEADPEYRCFHLDGQTIVLEDYLEVRPEARDRLLDHIRAGRILVGPWYNLPDEWLISGESYIRNLMRGRRMCRDLDVPSMNFFYTPDQFGHIAALPMIARGFGLQAGICWRGTQDEHYPAQFLWIGPDGSRLPTHKLMDKGGYAPFLSLARQAIEKAGSTDEAIEEHFPPYFAEEQKRAPLPLVLMLDAVDHAGPSPGMPKTLAKLREKHPDIEFVWDSLEVYGRELAAGAGQLPERHGELREPRRDVQRGDQYLIVHTLSSRYDLKQRNDQCQALIEKWAEPYALFHCWADGKPVAAYLDLAWQYLLRNHPHDSICGCSVDQVHRDMQYRFDQAEQLADGLVRRALARVGKADRSEESWQNVVVHNPLPQARREVVDIALFFPSDFGEKTGFIYHDGLATAERLFTFHLRNHSGQRIEYQHCRIERGVTCHRLDATGREKVASGDIYHVAAELDLPSCGYTGIAIEGTHDATRTFGSQKTGLLSAANDDIAVTVQHNGSVNLEDKHTGARYNGLFCYEDAGDCGDGWTYGTPIDDIAYRGPGGRIDTAIEEDGPLRTVFRIERTFRLSASLDRKTGARSEARTDLQVTDFLCVEKHCPALRVRTVVHNTVRDHRLRVLFPTGIDADTSFADTPFAHVERDIAVPEETRFWQERVNPEKAFTSYFGLQGEDGGLAVIAPAGLHEYAVTETPDRSLALTLFRAFFKTVKQEMEQDGELQGDLEFEYLLYPFAATFNPVAAIALAARANAAPRYHHTATLPEAHSFLRLDRNAAVVTAIKPSAEDNAAIVRFWNPSAEDVGDRLRVSLPLAAVERCNLDEAPEEAIGIEADGSVPFTVPARGLLTLKLRADGARS